MQSYSSQFDSGTDRCWSTKQPRSEAAAIAAPPLRASREYSRLARIRHLVMAAHRKRGYQVELTRRRSPSRIICLAPWTMPCLYAQITAEYTMQSHSTFFQRIKHNVKIDIKHPPRLFGYFKSKLLHLIIGNVPTNSVKSRVWQKWIGMCNIRGYKCHKIVLIWWNHVDSD